MSSFERKTQVEEILTRLNSLSDYKAVQFGFPAIPNRYLKINEQPVSLWAMPF